MARINQDREYGIEVDGEPYVWRLRRRPQWTGAPAAWRGMAIAVRHRDGQRDAVIEFAPGPRPRLGAPQLQPSQIPTALVARAIASAVAAGWAPLSRGKPVAIVVDEDGG
jgi:hypothetical protein